jgi:hypothetical protein
VQADRQQHPDLLDRLAAVLEEPPQAGGGEGQGDVLHRPAQLLLHPFHLRQRHLHRRQPAACPDRLVEARMGRRRELVVGQRLRHRPRLREDSHHLVRVDRGVDAAGSLADHPAQAHQRTPLRFFAEPGDHRRQLLRGLLGVGFGLGVEQRRHQGHTADPVDEAVVDLADERPAASLQALQQRRLPERAIAVEPLREIVAEPGHQLRLATGLRQARGADQLADVEGRVGEPDRQRKLAHPRHREAAAQEGGLVDPLAHLLTHLLEGGASAVRGRVEDDRPADLHVDEVVGLLDLEEGRVEGAQVTAHRPAS